MTKNLIKGVDHVGVCVVYFCHDGKSEFVFTPKIEYELVAERSEANQNSLTFPFWCRGGDSNSQALRCAILSRVRLPISPPRQVLRQRQFTIKMLFIQYEKA